MNPWIGVSPAVMAERIDAAWCSHCLILLEWDGEIHLSQQWMELAG